MSLLYTYVGIYFLYTYILKQQNYTRIYFFVRIYFKTIEYTIYEVRYTKYVIRSTKEAALHIL